jgi:3',5'-cyclic-AMP phosphodiesterase
MTDDRRYVLIQISDVHLVTQGLLHGYIEPFRNLETILSQIEDSGIHPDALLLSGDLADTGESSAYAQLRVTVGDAARRLGAMVVYLPGNHDLRQTFREELLDRLPADGPLDQVAWCGELRIIALDSSRANQDHGELSDTQLERLAAELATPAPHGTILALHHPPIPSPIEFMSQIALREPERLGELIAGSDVRIVLAGHNHHGSAGLLAGVPVFVAPAASYQADVLLQGPGFRGLEGSAFARIDVARRGVVATIVPAHPRRSGSCMTSSPRPASPKA